MGQPLVVDGIEEAPDVGVHDPTQVRARDAYGQRIQRLVLATPGPESVRAAGGARIEDRVKHCHDDPLNNLVLQRRNPQLDWGQTQAWIT